MSENEDGPWEAIPLPDEALRDHFAGIALGKLPVMSDYPEMDIARWAYTMADAMMAARDE